MAKRTRPLGILLQYQKHLVQLMIQLTTWLLKSKGIKSGNHLIGHLLSRVVWMHPFDFVTIIPGMKFWRACLDVLKH